MVWLNSSCVVNNKLKEIRTHYVHNFNHIGVGVLSMESVSLDSANGNIRLEGKFNNGLKMKFQKLFDSSQVFSTFAARF